MKNAMIVLAMATIMIACQPAEDEVFFTEEGFEEVALQSEITSVQPMTGLVLWPSYNSTGKYAPVITLEFQYCLPCRVVTGKVDGVLQYDWSYLEDILDKMASRNHQAILRFRYEYPSNKDVDSEVPGATAVPQYIKDLPDYNETFKQNAGGDGPTYYADWTNAELQWFTKQFYTDFAARYNNDPRIAFIELGFGHWSEYHIYGTPLKLGTNFPSKEYQKEFLLHVDNVLDIPWAISIDAADNGYTPIVADKDLMALNFGLFDDSFMHEHHEIKQGDGYNERCWNSIGEDKRWQVGVCGGEVSYYTRNDQRNFLNPEGMYGWTWEAASAKYHITFMISNDAPGGIYGTVDRFREAGIAVGYSLRVLRCATNGSETRLSITNDGVAPLYRDAYFAIGDTKSEVSLKGLLPQDTLRISIPAGLSAPEELNVVCPHILPSQKIEFAADIVLNSK